MFTRLAATAIAVSLVATPCAWAQCGSQGVVAYEASWCKWCTMIKRMLDENHIEYTPIDIETTPHAKEFLTRRFGSAGVPVTFVDQQPIVGYDLDALHRALCIR